MLEPNNRVKRGNVILGKANGDSYVGLQPTAFICFCRAKNGSCKSDFLFSYED